MNSVDREYFRLVENILDNGELKEDRTGTGTLEIFGERLVFDLQEGFPLLTSKNLSFRIIAEELFWFLSGSTDLGWLLERNVNIWNKDGYRFYKERGGKKTYNEFITMANQQGFHLGNIYGYNLRNWRGVDGRSVDQIANVIESLRDTPYSRRHVVTTWNPTVLDQICLPSCHGVAIQFHVNNNELSCQVYIRSSDTFLGLPYNIASYALLTYLIAHMLGYGVGELIIVTGSSHIYLNHVEALKEQITREPKELPRLNIKKKHNKIEHYRIDDIELIGYNPHPTIKGELSVGLDNE